MTDRLPWFRCFPSALLGAMAGLEPDEGYTYVAVLLRIYETGGPVVETARTLARRTGLAERKVAAALASLQSAGKLLVTADGLLDSATTHAEIKWQNDRKADASTAGKASAAKRAEKPAAERKLAQAQKAKQNQRNGANARSTAVQLLRVRLRYRKIDHRLTSVTRARNLRLPLPRKIKWPKDAFERWYSGYPHKVGRAAAEKSFERIRKAGRVPFADLIAGRDRYIASKPPDREWCNPATWLNQGRWADAPAAGPLARVNGHHHEPNRKPSVQDIAREMQSRLFEENADDQSPRGPTSRPFSLLEGVSYQPSAHPPRLLS